MKIFSRKDLALYLSPFVLSREIRPYQDPSVFPSFVDETNVFCIEPAMAQWDGGSLTKLSTALSEVVYNAMKSCNRVAVALSGGLDSALIAQKVIESAGKSGEKCEILLLTSDMRDEKGRSSAQLAKKLFSPLSRLSQTSLSFLTLDTIEESKREWNPLGPALEAIPESANALVRKAAKEGAEIVFYGDGADELFTVPDLAFQFIKHHLPKNQQKLLWDDMKKTSQSFSLSSAFFSSVMSKNLAKSVFLKSQYPRGWPSINILKSPYREYVLSWTNNVFQTIEATLFHAYSDKDNKSVASMAAWMQAFPQRRPDSEKIQRISPFLAQEVVESAVSLPLRYRWNPKFSTSYQRTKAPIAEMLSSNIRENIVGDKMIYTNHILCRKKCVFPSTLIELGIINEITYEKYFKIVEWATRKSRNQRRNLERYWKTIKTLDVVTRMENWVVDTKHAGFI